MDNERLIRVLNKLNERVTRRTGNYFITVKHSPKHHELWVEAYSLLTKFYIKYGNLIEECKK